MESFDIRESSVIVNESEVQFPEKINKSIEIGGKLIVLMNTLDRKNISDNVWAIDRDGEIEWKIEPAHSKDPYTGLWEEEGEVWAYNWDGFGYKIDDETGDIVDSKFMK